VKPVDVAGVERSGEAVVDGVGDFDGFFKSREFHERDHGSEDFFAARCAWMALRRRGRSAQESAVCVGALSQRVTAAEEHGAFFECDVDVAG